MFHVKHSVFCFKVISTASLILILFLPSQLNGVLANERINHRLAADGLNLRECGQRWILFIQKVNSFAKVS